MVARGRAEAGQPHRRETCTSLLGQRSRETSGDVLAVDVDVDEPAQRAGLVADPAHEGRLAGTDRVEEGGDVARRGSDRERAAPGEVGERRRQADGDGVGRDVAHGRTAARSDSTSGRCSATVAGKSPSSPRVDHAVARAEVDARGVVGVDARRVAEDDGPALVGQPVPSSVHESPASRVR
jgi:hypothetical protein